MKKILFLIPPENDKLVMERDKEVTDAFGTYPPLGLMYIATYLKKQLKNKIKVKITDCTLGHWDLDKLKKLLSGAKPDMIGISAMTPTILDVKKTLEIIKEILPKTIVVVGGPHVNSFPKATLHFPEVDYAISNYAEDSFYKLTLALFFDGKLKEVPNLIYRKGDQILINPPSKEILHIDDIPIPDRSLIEYKKYRCPVGTRDIMVTAVSSRGCPFRCTFCNSPDKMYKGRSIENVIEEVKYISKLGVKEVFFFDDLFNLTEDRVLDFCKLMKKNKIKIAWGFKSRVTPINDKLLKAAKETGCERIHFGIETHTNKHLMKLKKNITIDQIRQAVDLCYKYKINSVGSFMINLPGDTKQDILDRIKFVNSLKLDYVQYAIFIAYNHTEIFEDGVKEGLWDKDLWLNYVLNPTPDFVAPLWENNISREELDRLVKKGLSSFYLRPKYILQRIRNIHSFEEIKKYFFGGLKLIKMKLFS